MNESKFGFVNPYDRDYWLDINGIKYEIQHMSTSHIKNCINMIYRNGHGHLFEDSVLDFSFRQELERRELNDI